MIWRLLLIIFIYNLWLLDLLGYQNNNNNMKCNKYVNEYTIVNIPSLKLFVKRPQRSVHKAIHQKFYSIIDDSIDVSPTNNGSIYKKVLRKGNKNKGYPLNKDNVEILWRIYDINRNLVHDLYNSSSSSTALSNTDNIILGEVDIELFNFQLGAEPREVILGWEIGIKTMLEGEIASFTIQSELAFGTKGALPLIEPNATIICEIELVTILPSPLRKYKAVGYDESIREELMEQIETGESPIARPVTHKNSNQNSNETGTEAKFFNSEIHKIDPRLQVTGESDDGYTWKENTNVLDIDLKLPLSSKPIHKSDLLIEINSNSIKISLKTGQVLLEGPLHGKINPSETSWAILTADELNSQSRNDESNISYYPGTILQIFLEKSFGYNDIWATVISRDYLNSKNNNKQSSEIINNNENDDLYLQ